MATKHQLEEQIENLAFIIDELNKKFHSLTTDVQILYIRDETRFKKEQLKEQKKLEKKAKSESAKPSKKKKKSMCIGCGKDCGHKRLHCNKCGCD